LPRYAVSKNDFNLPKVVTNLICLSVTAEEFGVVEPLQMGPAGIQPLLPGRHQTGLTADGCLYASGVRREITVG
jgi:hypothetical protein